MHRLSFLFIDLLTLTNAALAAAVREQVDHPQVRTVVVKESQPIAYICNGTTITSTSTNLRTITDTIYREPCTTVSQRPTTTVITSLETSCLTFTTTIGMGSVITSTRTTTITQLSTKCLTPPYNLDCQTKTTILTASTDEIADSNPGASHGELTGWTESTPTVAAETSGSLEEVEAEDQSQAPTSTGAPSESDSTWLDQEGLSTSLGGISSEIGLASSSGEESLSVIPSSPTTSKSHLTSLGLISSSTDTSEHTKTEGLDGDETSLITKPSPTVVEQGSTTLVSLTQTPSSTDDSGEVEAEVEETTSPLSSPSSYSPTLQPTQPQTSLSIATDVVTGPDVTPTSMGTETPIVSSASEDLSTSSEVETESTHAVTPTPIEPSPTTFSTVTNEVSPSSEPEPETENTPETSTISETPTLGEDERFVTVTAAGSQGTSSTFTVPAAATAMRFVVQGGCGGNGWASFMGGRGGRSALLTRIVPVSPGQQIAARAGGSGAPSGGQGGTGGYGDGGSAIPGPNMNPIFAAGGGAGSAVLIDGELLVVSPGGGGGGIAVVPHMFVSEDGLRGDANITEARGQGFAADAPGPGQAEEFPFVARVSGGQTRAAGNSEPGEGGIVTPPDIDFPDAPGFESSFQNGLPGDGINGGGGLCLLPMYCGGGGGGGYGGGGGGAVAGVSAPGESGDGHNPHYLFGGGGAGSMYLGQDELDVNVTTGTDVPCVPGNVAVEFM